MRHPRDPDTSQIGDPAGAATDSWPGPPRGGNAAGRGACLEPCLRQAVRRQGVDRPSCRETDRAALDVRRSGDHRPHLLFWPIKKRDPAHGGIDCVFRLLGHGGTAAVVVVERVDRAMDRDDQRASAFNIRSDICAEARFVERAFGLAPPLWPRACSFSTRVSGSKLHDKPTRPSTAAFARPRPAFATERFAVLSKEVPFSALLFPGISSTRQHFGSRVCKANCLSSR